MSHRPGVTRRTSIEGMAAFTVRVPPEIKAWLDEKANADNIARGLLVESLLVKAMQAECSNQSAP